MCCSRCRQSGAAERQSVAGGPTGVISNHEYGRRCATSAFNARPPLAVAGGCLVRYTQFATPGRWRRLPPEGIRRHLNPARLASALTADSPLNQRIQQPQRFPR